MNKDQSGVSQHSKVFLWPIKGSAGLELASEKLGMEISMCSWTNLPKSFPQGFHLFAHEPNDLSILRFSPRVSKDFMIHGACYLGEDISEQGVLIPRLVESSTFLVTSEFLNDFLDIEAVSQDTIVNELLLASAKANRCGYRFYGLHSAKGLASKKLATNESVFSGNAEQENIDNDALFSNDLKVAQFRQAMTRSTNSILLDMAHCAPFENGTTILVREIIRNSGDYFKAQDVVYVRCTPEFFRYLQCDVLIPNCMRIDSLSDIQFVRVMFVMGQPWHIADVELIVSRAAFIYFLIMDSIALDCSYIRVGYPELDRLWKFWAEYANGFVYISEFTKRIFESRFPSAKDKNGKVVLLPTTASSYTNQEVKETVAFGNRFLIFGNHFSHKFTNELIGVLLRRFKDSAEITLVGHYHGELPTNVKVHPSGGMSRTQLDQLMRDHQVLFYPSQYEGFGLPIVEGLANGLNVFARDTLLNHEVLSQWHGPGNLILYKDLAYLVKILEQALEHGILPTVTRSQAVQGRTWQDVGRDCSDLLAQSKLGQSSIQFAEKRYYLFDIQNGIAKKSTSR